MHGVRRTVQFRRPPELPWTSVATNDPRLITVQRSTVVRVGIVALILAALGAGIGIGLTVGAKSSPPASKSTVGSNPSSTPVHVSTTTSPLTTTTVAALPS